LEEENFTSTVLLGSEIYLLVLRQLRGLRFLMDG
jgi:hypothetical protein